MEKPVLHSVLVIHSHGTHTLECHHGDNLRALLMRHQLSPYGRFSNFINCDGRGLCATCGVRIHNGPKPSHWHDKLADSCGYPRLSCQIQVFSDMTVKLIDGKIFWGQVWPSFSDHEA